MNEDIISLDVAIELSKLVNWTDIPKFSKCYIVDKNESKLSKGFHSWRLKYSSDLQGLIDNEINELNYQVYPAPPQWWVQKWLREKYACNVYVTIDKIIYCNCFVEYINEDKYELCGSSCKYYEDAMNAGLKTVIKYIIKNK